MKPKSVNILGITYEIKYVEKPSDVDACGRESLWGQIDFWTRTIRVYDGGRANEDIFQVILHEILHGIAYELKIQQLNGKENDDAVDLLALALADILFRNEWLSH